jgi:beta-galactosidase/beta-glucuronidase
MYTKTLQASTEWFAGGGRLWLDLGEVKNIAEVTVNGKPLGIVWMKPFRVDVTGALTAGSNELRVKITNLWVNRLIGDRQPGVTKKYTYTTQPFYRADSPLLPSGLIGPVRVILD